MNGNMNELTITIPRDQLITTLEEKITEVTTAFDEKVKEVQKEIDERPKNAQLHAEWYKAIAKLLKDGKATVRASGDVVPVGDQEIPEKPSSSKNAASVRDLKAEQQGLEDEKQHVLDQINAGLRLLRLATDANVSIPVSQYEAMLAVTARRRRWYNNRYYY